MSGFRFNLTPRDVAPVSTKHRRIKTKIPVPQSLPILARVEELESTSMHGALPVLWDRAEGHNVYDAWGNKWLDFTSTIFVTNAGHGNKRIRKAMKKVIDKPLLHTYMYVSRERADYLEYLIAKTPAHLDKAFMLSAGTEATECALKLMRMNGWKTGKKRPGILAFEGNWHGRTLGAQMMGWNPAQKEWIGYQDPNIHHLPFPYPWREEAMKDPRKYFREAIAKLCAEKNLDPKQDLCGVMMETWQGWCAAMYPPAFAQEVEAFCRENGLLLAFDEMQSGFGRTGKLFGYMHYGVEPDLLCCGKGAASSVPLSLVLGRKAIMDLPEIGSMSSTHSANPLVCAAGKANLQAILEDGLMANAERLGPVFQAELEKIRAAHPKHVSRIIGVGQVAAIIFRDPADQALAWLGDRASELSMERGLLVVHTGRESIKIAPPLSITEDALREGCAVLASSVADAIRERG